MHYEGKKDKKSYICMFRVYKVAWSEKEIRCDEYPERNDYHQLEGNTFLVMVFNDRGNIVIHGYPVV